jgi:putative membrane protein
MHCGVRLLRSGSVPACGACSPTYMQNHVFLTKMGLLLVILVLEVWPMVTLMRWRRSFAGGEPVDTRAGPRLARISFVQAWVVVLMVLAATAMARGIGGPAK